MNIYVGNLPYTMTEAELNEMFSEFGQVNSAKIILDKMSGKSKGFGFIEMATEADGQRAVEELNNKQIGGRTILVSKARDPQPRPQRNSFRGPRY